MKWGLNWTANRFALFNYSIGAAGRYVNFNWFHYSIAHPVNDTLPQQKQGVKILKVAGELYPKNHTDT